MPSSSPHASSGFTLLEVMVAMAVAGIVLTALFAVYSSVMDAAERVQRRADVLHTARLGLAQLTRDLDAVYVAGNASEKETEEQESIESAPWYAFKGQNPSMPLTTETITILDFPTLASLDLAGAFPGQTLHRVIYSLNQSDQDETLFDLQRRDIPLPYLSNEEERDNQPGLAMTVMENIKNVSLSFITRDESLPRNEWGLDWGLDEDTKAPIPAAVRLEVVLKDKSGQNHRFKLFRVLAR